VRVFSDREALGRLNALVHPPVIAREEKMIAEFAAREPKGIAVVEGAILIETGSYRRFDRLIVVSCREEQQVERAMRRDGVTEAEVRARLSRQMPLAEKRKLADFVIDTSGDKENTLRHASTIYAELRRIEA
jgi:dephospho-CoA kinase